MFFSKRNCNSRMIKAANRGDTENVKRGLAAGADVHAWNDEALKVAALMGHTETVKVLLAAGADVRADGNYALQAAAWKGHTETVKVLLEHEADVHAEDEEALRSAAWNGHAETVKVLLAGGADLRAALRAAVMEKTRSALKAFIDAKCKLDGEAEYLSWGKSPARPERCPQCGRGVARLPMVNAPRS